ncbi:MAG: type II methionyl aminopeptidase [Ignisphaera sp.]|uniref:Methionine aminopeptidase n=1 Tax=Ignisphaera aggregans TaxID=334771 RepID=A0A7J3I5F4_9CREN
MLDDEAIQKYIEAGRIACIVRKEVEKYVKVGMNLIDIAKYVEQRIVELNAAPAFPTNISVDSIAAHYTPELDDKLMVTENSIVKIDLGVHVDGYIADTALTIVFDEKYRTLAEAAREALERAIKVVNKGVKFNEVGSIIDKTIKSYGYSPIYNLSGHSVDRYTIHAGDVIPNFRDRTNFGSFKSGSVYAIEPFASTGAGYVENGDRTTIYSLKLNPKKLNKLSSDIQIVFNTIYSERRALPFALRWYTDRYKLELLLHSIKIFLSQGLAVGYPILIERSKGFVAQYEHTVMISNNGEKIVTTDGC